MAQLPTLAELVGQVILEGLTDPRDPVQQLGTAERMAGELSHLGDSLIGFFVEQARADGLSWSDIGAARGLSRQGAQQRYSPYLARLTLADLIEAGVLRQFVDSAVAGLRRAESHAARLGHDAIDGGDLLLAILDDDQAPVVAALRALGADPSALRDELDRPEADNTDQTADERSADRSVSIAVGAEARRALDGAVAEARGHRVGLSHLLLALLRNPAARGGQALATRGITRAAVLSALVALSNQHSADRK